MAGAGLWFFFFAVLLQLAAFGAPAPSGSGGLHEEKPHKEGDPEENPKVESPALIKTESAQPQSGAASSDSFHPDKAKDSKDLVTETKNLDPPVSNSLVGNPNPKDPKDSEKSQSNKPKGEDVADPSPEKLHLKDSEDLAPAATESSHPHTSLSDSSAKKTDLNEGKQSGSLKAESVASAPDSPPLKSDPNETKGTENLPPSAENGPSVPKPPSHDSDRNEANQSEKLPEESKTRQSGVSPVDPSPRKPDRNEDNQSEKLPEKSETLQSESVADSPSPKSGQNEDGQNEKAPHSGAADAGPNSQKSDLNEDKQKDGVPVVPENDLTDTSIPKDDDVDDDDVDDDSMADDGTIGGGKEGEETAETSQSEKEEAKNSPVGPSPKNGSENSHFFAYLVTTAIVVAALYIAYHNKRKIIAFALEGKKSKVIRRPKSSDYQRLDQKI